MQLFHEFRNFSETLEKYASLGRPTDSKLRSETDLFLYTYEKGEYFWTLARTFVV
jgi:hypothetical protein